MRRVGLATCRQFPDLEAPEQLVLAPLAARGVEGVPVVWDDPDVDWAGFELVVNRGTWDYAERLPEFARWLEAVTSASRLENPLHVVRWNLDKRYLADLAGAGLPTVPTTFLSPGADVVLPSDGGFVVKPTVSAGSRDTALYRAGADDATALAHVTRLHTAGREVMVQPYVESVDTEGETALLYVDGEWSHAIRKGPLLEAGKPPTEGLFAVETIEPRRPSAAEREVADAVVDLLDRRFGTLLFARVDLLAGPAGPVVLEVELTEPSLFLDTDQAAAGRLADAIVARL